MKPSILASLPRPLPLRSLCFLILLFSPRSTFADLPWIAEPPAAGREGTNLNQVLDVLNGPTPPCSHTASSPRAQSVEAAPGLASCSFNSTTQELPTLPLNWGLEATGADLLRLYLKVIDADYSKGKLAIIDTGLKAKMNPEAGTSISEASPEVEYDIHGTHVAGIAASQYYGVNPRLKLQAIPVPYNGNPLSFVPQGFDPDRLVAGIKAAASDPSIQVINLSLSSAEDPLLEEAIEYALKNNKWIVYAGGNDRSVNSSKSAGLERFKNKPGLFVVGALSPYAAPSEFSDRGPHVRFYAPGSFIESLDASYNPNLKDSRASLLLSGSSMASPHFAAVLQTMRIMSPNLKPNEAEKILETTAIQRGTSPTLLQLNAYGAIRLLDQVDTCRKRRKTESFESCLKSGEKKLLEEAALHFRSPPASSSGCVDWQFYFEELRRGYFLSKGSEKFSRAIEDLVQRSNQRNSARISVFSTARSNALRVAPPGFNDPMLKDYSLAKRFFSGDVQVFQSSEDPLIPAGRIKDIPAQRKYLSQVFSACKPYFLYGNKEPQDCAHYLYDAPKDFKIAFAEQLLNAGLPLATIEPASALTRYDDAQSQELKQKLLKLVVEGWTIRGDYGALGTLVRWTEEMDPQTRQTFALLLYAAKGAPKPAGVDQYDYESLPTWYAVVASHLPPQVLEGSLRTSPQELEIALIPQSSKRDIRFDPLIGALKFEGYRARSGNGNPERFEEKLRSLLGHVRLDQANPTEGPDGAVFEYGDNRHNTASILNGIKDPGIAKRIAAVLSEPQNLRKLETIGDSSLILKELFPLLPPDHQESMIQAILSNWKSGGEAVRGFATEDEIPGDGVYGFLKAFPSSEASKKLLDQVTRKNPSDSTIQKLRLAYLYDRATEESPDPSLVQAFLEESEGGPARNILKLPAQQVAETPERIRYLNEAIQSAARGTTTSDEVIQFAVSSDEQTFQRFAPEYLKNIQGLLEAIEYDNSGYRMEDLFEGFVRVYGSNPEIMASLCTQLQGLIKNKKYTDRPLARKHNITTNPGGVLLYKLTLALNRSVAGAAYLKSHPEYFSDLADWMASPAGAEARLGMGKNFPPALLEDLRHRLPAETAIPLTREGYLADWVEAVIETQPEALTQALDYLETAHNRSDLTEEKKSYLVRDLTYAIQNVLKVHPNRSAEMLKTIREWEDRTNRPL